jgi:hypothetical protein
MSHPLVGKPAPALSLPNADGTTYELKPGGEGKPTAVFFYPKAGACPLLAVLLRLVIRGYALAQGPMAARGKSALSGMRSAVRHPMVQHPVTKTGLKGRACTEKIEFKDSGITVVGVSPDPVAAIKTFATKHNVTVCGLICALPCAIFLIAS